MFKIIFRTITIIVFIAILIVALAAWKGGKPFRWLGKKTEAVGVAIGQFGDMIDNLKGKKEEVKKTYKEIKETLSEGKEAITKEYKGKGDGTDTKGRRY
jgi:nitrogen fixation/metabolism regulation signal transduction histidine kinase